MTRVIFVAGIGRCGSTILGSILGSAPGAVGLGEVAHLWQRAGAGSCGCGERLASCPFWSEVGDRAFGAWDASVWEPFRELRTIVDRQRHVPKLLRNTRANRNLGGTSGRQLSGTFGRQLGDYQHALGSVYRAACEVSSSTAVVDTSKWISSAAIVAGIPNVDLRTIHLVRDPRGVAHSWNKSVLKPDAIADNDLMERMSAAETSRLWMIDYVLHKRILSQFGPVLHVRYEDLVEKPQVELERIADFAGLNLPPGFILDKSIQLRPIHAAAGNPVRFTTGRLKVKPDVAWHRDLGQRNRRITTALTFPGLVHSRYPLTAPSGSDHDANPRLRSVA